MDTPDADVQTRSPAIAELERNLARRRADGLSRTRHIVESAQGPRIRIGDRTLLAFASNDYLGLANSPSIVAAARIAAERWGVGAAASHLVVGHAAPHAALEDELAAFVASCDNARALAFSSGYLANLAILTALAGRNDVVFADRLNHACLTDGALLSRATLHRYAHCDVAGLAGALTKSADAAGSSSPTRCSAWTATLRRCRSYWNLPARMTHGSSSTMRTDSACSGQGRGTLADFGLQSERIVYMGTLGKAAGVAGAFVAGHESVVETLLQTARSYIYTTAAPPLLAEALRAALRSIRDDAYRREHLPGSSRHSGHRPTACHGRCFHHRRRSSPS